MLYYFIPYGRLQELLAAGGPDFTRGIGELVKGEKLVELRCPFCGEFFIAAFRPGSLDKPCPACRASMAEEGGEADGRRRGGGRGSSGREEEKAAKTGAPERPR
ncbi:MAG: hypothetical protein H5T74_06635 [Actinobacteria bacterium]|nr:hypothetical protein [Actinomycetota bacterium]